MIRVRMPWRGFMPLITLLIGCGTMHHFVPPAPPRLETGELEATIGITWSPYDIYPYTVQLSSYFALGANATISPSASVSATITIIDESNTASGIAVATGYPISVTNRSFPRLPG
ncbi:MAG: hypothetical protein ABI876_01580 [Bacteroidota bacterium]